MKPKRKAVYSLKKRIVYLKCQLQSLKSPKAVEIVSKAAKINCQKCNKCCITKTENKKHEKMMNIYPHIDCEKFGKVF